MKQTSENKEDAILKAAELEFMEKGFDGARTVSIAKAAGVTHAMLHYYFRTKENLFNKVFQNKIELLYSSVFTIFQNKDIPFLERLKLTIGTHFDFVAQNPMLPRFVINELVEKPERLDVIRSTVSAIISRFANGLETELDQLVKEHKIAPITLIDLLIDILSLNVFLFIINPIIVAVSPMARDHWDAFLIQRRRENTELIMRRLMITQNTDNQ